MKRITYVLALLFFIACNDNNGIEDIDKEISPVEFSFSSSSVSSKRYGLSGRNFEVGDTLLIGQYKTKSDGTIDYSAPNDAQYFTVATYHVRDEIVTSVAPVATPLYTLPSSVGDNGKAAYTIVVGGDGKSFPLTIFDNVDDLVELNFTNSDSVLDYNYDILSQITPAIEGNEVSFDNLEHLAAQINIIVEDFEKIGLEKIAYAGFFTKSLTPVHSGTVDYSKSEFAQLSSGENYYFMDVTSEKEGINFRGYLLPSHDISEGAFWGNLFFYFSNGDIFKLFFQTDVKPGYRYTMRTAMVPDDDESVVKSSKGSSLKPVILDIDEEPL